MLTNLFPTCAAPESCSFITNRIKAHHALGNEVTAVAISPDFGFITTALRGAHRIQQLRPSSSSFIRSGGYISSTDFVSLRRWGLSERVARNIAKTILSRVSGPFDVIHAHGMYAFAAGSIARELSRLIGVPYVVSLHGSDVNYRLNRRSAERFRSALNASNGVLPVSSALLDRVQKFGVRSDLCQVLPNGVDLELFTPTKDKHMASKGWRVAFVGRLEFVKGADRLPAVFHKVASIVPDISFDIVGTGSLREDLERSVTSLDVTFHGALAHDRVARVMAESDVLVLPSRNEGWPTVILEAFASGTPVIGTDVGGVREAAATPRFVVPTDTNVESELANRLIDILSDPPDISTLVARAEQFSWERIAEEETSVYRSTTSK